MTNTTTSTNTTNESRFFDLTNISEGYVNRIRLVKQQKGNLFMLVLYVLAIYQSM